MKLLLSIILAVTMGSDSVLFEAYQREDMTVWKEYIDSYNSQLDDFSQLSTFNSPLLYEYGYCGYIIAEAKKEGNEALMPDAKRYVVNFKSQISNLQSQLPIGHYEMYMSAVYVYELRLHESIHPLKAMSLAKRATQLAPNDPIVLSYYGTCLFYAPKPFGSKEEALKWFEKAQPLFQDPKWQYCWLREANEMYIQQCKQKLKE